MIQASETKYNICDIAVVGGWVRKIMELNIWKKRAEIMIMMLKCKKMEYKLI